MNSDEKPVPEVIQARRFEVVDEEGSILVQIGKTNKGFGSVCCNRSDGKLMVGLLAHETGGGLLISNAKEKLVAAISSFAHGGYMLVNSNDGQAVKISPTKEGDGAIAIYNKKNNKIINISRTNYILNNLRSLVFPAIFFITAIITAFIAAKLGMSYRVRDYAPLIYSLGLISASCFISSAMVFRMKGEFKYEESISCNGFDKEVSP